MHARLHKCCVQRFRAASGLLVFRSIFFLAFVALPIATDKHEVLVFFFCTFAFCRFAMFSVLQPLCTDERFPSSPPPFCSFNLFCLSSLFGLCFGFCFILLLLLLSMVLFRSALNFRPSLCVSCSMINASSFFFCCSIQLHDILFCYAKTLWHAVLVHVHECGGETTFIFMLELQKSYQLWFVLKVQYQYQVSLPADVLFHDALAVLCVHFGLSKDGGKLSVGEEIAS